jgi:hypothetical protein
MNMKCKSNANTMTIKVTMISVGVQLGVTANKTIAAAASGAPCSTDLAGDASGGAFGAGFVAVGTGGMGISIKNGGTIVSLSGGLARAIKGLKGFGASATYMTGRSEMISSSCPGGKCC